MSQAGRDGWCRTNCSDCRIVAPHPGAVVETCSWLGGYSGAADVPASGVFLDFGPFMMSAHRLYEAEGFRDRPIYDDAEVPSVLHHDWRFMERSLP